MFKRGVTFGIAVLIAGGVFYLTMQAEPRSGRDAGNRIQPLEGWDMQQVPADPGSNLPRRFYRYFIEFPSERGILYQIYGKALNPLPNGVMNIESPMARIHLKRNQRVLQISADEGTFIAPANRPRSGNFTGNVVFTVFEAPDGEEADLTDESEDAVMRLFLEETRFDLELGQIQSDGPVKMIGDRFDFTGRDLDISFNELHKRLDRLEISRGEVLRIRRDPGQSQAASAQATSDDGGNAATQARPSDEVEHYYQAVFDQQVNVLNMNTRIEGDRLTVLFGTRLRSPRNQNFRDSSGGESRDARSGGASEATAAAGSSEFPPSSPKPDAPGPKPPDPTDIVVQWNGNLLVTPRTDRPEELATVDDSYLMLDGSPMRITPPNGESITGTQIAYRTSDHEVHLKGSPTHPMTIQSPQLGTLLGERLVIDMDNATGQILGAGRLRVGGDLSEQGSINPADTSRLPAGTNIAWHDRVDLTFHGNGAAGGMDIEAIKAVAFRGNTSIEHFQFNLTADLLSAILSPPSDGRQTLDALSAIGDVTIRSIARADGDQMTVRGDEVHVGLTPNDAGDVQPSHLTVKGNVRAVRPRQTLTSRELTVHLRQPESAAPRPAGGTAANSAPSDGDVAKTALDRMFAGQVDDKPPGSTVPSPTPASHPRQDQAVDVRDVVAKGDVRIEIEDMGIVVEADEVFAENDQIEIFGRDGREARIIRHDGILFGRHIVLVPHDESIRVIGAGSLQFRSAPPKEKTAKLPAIIVGEQPLVTIAWRENMHFYHKTAIAQFFGDVSINAGRALDTTTLRASELAVQFTTFAPLAKLDATAAGAATNGDAPNARVMSAAQSIRTVTASKDVTFEAATWADRPGGKVATRLWIAGPTMVFDNLLEQVHVVGEGKMLVQDYRNAAGGGGQSGGASPMVKITGKGDTVFTWKKQLNFDAVHNDMRIEEQVQMLHRPSDSTDFFQLDCRRLLADMDATGGLGAWLSDETPRPQLKAILADGAVRVLIQKREIHTDHLEYTGFDQIITLRADKDRLTRIYSDDGSSSAGAARFRWDLKRDWIEIEEPGRTIAPGR